MSLSIIFQAYIVSLWFNVTFNNFSGIYCFFVVSLCIYMPEKLLKVTLNHKETIFSSEQRFQTVGWQLSVYIFLPVTLLFGLMLNVLVNSYGHVGTVTVHLTVQA